MLIKWVQYIGGSDNTAPDGACVFGNYVVVVGSEGTREFLALLDRDTGRVVKTWKGDDISFLYACLSLSSNLYVIGLGNICIFDNLLHVVKRLPTKRSSTRCLSFSIASDGEHLYLGCISESDFWAVEKWTLDLTYIGRRVFNTAQWRGPGFIKKLAVNPVTGDIWAVGYYNIDRMLLVVFDKFLGVKHDSRLFCG